MFTLGLGLVVFAIRLFAHSMRGAFEENDKGEAPPRQNGADTSSET